MFIVLAAAAAKSAHAAAEAEKPGLPQLNSSSFVPQLFWLIVTFALLYWLLSRLVLPRIGQVIDERRNRISRDINEASRLKAETEKSIASYEQALTEARGKAQGIVGQQRDALAKEMASERAKVEQSIADKTTAAEQQIAQLKAGALAQVNSIAGDAVGSIVAKLIGIEPQAAEIQAALSKQPS